MILIDSDVTNIVQLRILAATAQDSLAKENDLAGGKTVF